MRSAAACKPGARGHDGAMPFQRGSSLEPRWNDTAAPRWVPRSGIGARRPSGAKAVCRGLYGLLAQTELVDQRRVALGILVLQIVQQLAATAHHLEQAAPAVVVFQVRLEVRGQFVDACGEQRDLNFRGAGVVSAARALLDDFGLLDGCHGHGIDFLLTRNRPGPAAASVSRFSLADSG